MADVFAYLLTLSKAIDVDLIDAFFAKMEKNAHKYPIRQNEITPPRKRWLEQSLLTLPFIIPKPLRKQHSYCYPQIVVTEIFIGDALTKK